MNLQNIVIAGTVALGICLVSGPILIPFLRWLKFGQTIRTDGPRTHLKKSGTPTMGGIMFFFSITIGSVVAVGLNARTAALLLGTLGFGFIGFADDLIIIVKQRSLGLKAREKILGQILISGIFAYIAVAYLQRGTELIIPILNTSIDIGWFYIPFVIFIMVGTNNAVNLTDGLDGLAAGVTLFAALSYLLITKAWGQYELAAFSAALLGSCLGFLFYNINPARIFMGDTGSLALGGALGSLAVLTKTELLLPLIGGVYVLETLSVIIQVVYFKLTGGKRIFRMSPLHHHFELSGWSEQKVVIIFWIGAALFASLAVASALYV